MSGLIEGAAPVLLGVLAVAMLLACARLVLARTLPDRVVALDLMTSIGVGMIGVYALACDDSVYLDVAIVIALISFVGTVAIARYLEGGRR